MRTFALPAVLVALVALSTPARAFAYSFGITGQSMLGCGGGGCHGDLPGATVTLMGPQTLAEGAMGAYSLVITSTRSDFIQGGLDVSTTGGTLIASATEPNTMVMSGELTHTAPIRKGANGALTIPFSMQAPNSASCVTVYAAGNSTSGNGTTNCAWALASLRVAVGSGMCAGASDGGASADASTASDAAVQGDGNVTYDPSYSMGYGGCSVTPGGMGARGERAGAWLLAAAVVLGRCRRRS